MANDRQGLNTQWQHVDYTKWRAIFTKIWLDKLSDTEPNRHICKGYYTMESVYWFQNVMKFIHEMKTNYKDKNDTK